MKNQFFSILTIVIMAVVLLILNEVSVLSVTGWVYFFIFAAMLIGVMLDNLRKTE